MMSSLSFAVSELKLASLSTQSQISQYWKSGARRRFVSPHGSRIMTYSFSKGAGAPVIVIVPGRAEASSNFAELVYDLRNEKYSLYLIDHRGQGASDRLASDPEMGYVENFNYYVDDLRYFVENIVNPRKNKELFFFANSMGSNIATMLLKETPDMAKSLVVVSPMFKIKTGKIPMVVGRVLSYFKVVAGAAASFALGQTHWTKECEKFEGNLVSHSRLRFDCVMDSYKKNPAIRIAGPSYGWALEAFRSGSEIMNYKNKSFAVPTLLLSGGADEVVDLNVSRKFCLDKATLCYERNFPQGLHNLIQESDSIRIPALKAALGFFDAFLN